MKPFAIWSMEEKFLFTGIAILIIGTVAGLLFGWLQEKENDKDE